GFRPPSPQAVLALSAAIRGLGRRGAPNPNRVRLGPAPRLHPRGIQKREPPPRDAAWPTSTPARRQRSAGLGSARRQDSGAVLRPFRPLSRIASPGLFRAP